MCIIAVKPEKVQFTKNQCRTMWNANPHGAGFMYATGKKVEIVKGLMTFADFWDAYEAAGPLRKMVVHFRIKTHGDVNPENTHPFWVVKNKFALAHNGIIRPLVNKTSAAESDTAVFARMLAENYGNPIDAVNNSFIRSTLEEYIGHSKVVFMNAKGETIILNSRMGTWHQNVWYSNDSYKEPKKSEASEGWSKTLDQLVKKYGKDAVPVVDGNTYRPQKELSGPKQLIQAPEHFAPSPPKASYKAQGSSKPNTVFHAKDFDQDDAELAEAMQRWGN